VESQVRVPCSRKAIFTNSTLAELASAWYELSMSGGSVDTGRLAGLLQCIDCLLIVAQALTNKLSIDLVELKRYFRQMDEFSPGFCGGRKTFEVTRDASSICRLAIRGKPLFAHVPKLRKLLRKLRLFLRQGHQHRNVGLSQRRLLTSQNVDKITRAIAF
jgi:hypothetical protein